MANEYLDIMACVFVHHKGKDIKRCLLHSLGKIWDIFERLPDIAFSFKGTRFMNLLGIESGNVRVAYVTKETLRGQLQYFLRCERGWAWLTL